MFDIKHYKNFDKNILQEMKYIIILKDYNERYDH